MTDPTITERLEHLRTELRAERISYGELAELQALAERGLIPEGDTELLEAAGVPEFPADDRERKVREALRLTAAQLRQAADWCENGGPVFYDSTEALHRAEAAIRRLQEVRKLNQQGNPL